LPYISFGSTGGYLPKCPGVAMAQQRKIPFWEDAEVGFCQEAVSKCRHPTPPGYWMAVFRSEYFDILSTLMFSRSFNIYLSVYLSICLSIYLSIYILFMIGSSGMDDQVDN
jgi:hypothetical protein